MTMRRPQRRYTPRRPKASSESSDAIHREATQLASQAHRRVAVTAYASEDEKARARVKKITAINSPIECFRALIELAEELLAQIDPATAPAVREHVLPVEHWRERLRDLEEGRTFQIREPVPGPAGTTVPKYPEGDPR
jgi:hypothetical protein